MVRILEEKGHLHHRKSGREFVYRPTQERRCAGRSALQRVIETFYDGSLEEALAAHLLDGTKSVDSDELKRLSAIINCAREKGQ